MRISILNAGQQPDYLYGLVSGLSELPALEIEVVDSVNSEGLFDAFPRVTMLNLCGDNVSPQSIPSKIWRIAQYYIRLLIYTAFTRSQIFHIQWENSFILFDRTLLILYYKLFGKKLVYTAHNVYREARDGRASSLRWVSLKILYSFVDRIIVHTPKMKEELCLLFRVPPEKIAVVPHGINNRVQKRGATQEKARKTLGIPSSAHVVLFFGQIDEYKGVETLMDAVALRVFDDPSLLLLIAGKPKRQNEYMQNLRAQADKKIPQKNVMFFPHFIPDAEVETFFSAADCVALPYKKIFQSGVIFLAYRFGVPLIAADVGSFRDDIIDGVTGYICQPENPMDFARAIGAFFEGPLFLQREATRASINEFAEKQYSWKPIGQQTYKIYQNLIGQQ